MKLKFDRESRPFGFDVGAGSLRPGRFGGAPGIGYYQQFSKGGAVGSASARADGCAQRGKTKGKMVKMAGGGKC